MDPPLSRMAESSSRSPLAGGERARRRLLASCRAVAMSATAGIIRPKEITNVQGGARMPKTNAPKTKARPKLTLTVPPPLRPRGRLRARGSLREHSAALTGMVSYRILAVLSHSYSTPIQLRNARQTVLMRCGVLTQWTNDQDQAVDGMSRRAATLLAWALGGLSVAMLLASVAL